MKPDFSKSADGLIPAVIQDYKSGRVLMLGYMNQEAFEKTQAEKRVTFFSRSKQRLWTKGEESGNFLSLKELLIDCDKDTLLLKVNPLGPVCHTGADTCFEEQNTSVNFLAELEEIIRERKNNPS
jgi:phosphoribosyl-ATP pyrophosphohydrolase/phosphoribosyl-AMP cyclohydrolase